MFIYVSLISFCLFFLYSEEENNGSGLSFSLLEIKMVVKESDGNKIPGPDGFYFAFIKELCYLMKDGIRIMFDQFYGNSMLPRSFLSYLLEQRVFHNSPIEF